MSQTTKHLFVQLKAPRLRIRFVRVSACRKLVSRMADRLPLPGSVGRQAWRTSAAAAVRLPCGDTLLSRRGNWPTTAAQAHHVNERAAETEAGASAVAALVVLHRETSCIALTSPSSPALPPLPAGAPRTMSLGHPPGTLLPVESGTLRLSPPRRVCGLCLPCRICTGERCHDNRDCARVVPQTAMLAECR